MSSNSSNFNAQENSHHLSKMAEEDDDSNFLSDLDFIKFLIVGKRNLIWVLLIFLTSISGGYLYLRYTSPIYTSSSTLKFEIKNKGGSMMEILAPESENAFRMSDLSGEIELIKSNLVLEQVAEQLNLKIFYYSKGKILDEERYPTSVYSVDELEIFNDNYYGKKFDIEILNQKEYKLSYQNGNLHSETYLFGEEIKNDDFKFTINLISPLSPDIINKPFYFIFNSKPTQLAFLQENLEIKVENPEAGTFSISFKNKNNLKARDVIVIIDSIYQKEGLAEKYKSSEQIIKFLSQQLIENEENMERYEKKIQNFIVQHKSTDLKSDVIKNITELERMDKKLLELREKEILISEFFELITTDKKLDDFTLPGTDPNIVQINELINRYHDLRKQREQLLLSNKEGTMVLRLNTMELNGLKKQAIKIISQARKSILQEINELVKIKTQLEETVFNATPKDNELKKAQRLYTFYERQYLLVFDKKTEFEIAKSSTVPSFRILSAPVTSKTPIYPISKTIYLYALGIWLVLSLLLIIVQYFLHNTIDNLGELEKGTIAPVLGFVPKYLKGKMEFSSLVIDKSPKGPITEALRTIRTNIEFLLPNKNKRLISVTSTISGEGKTFVSINLAGVISLSGQKVVIIDLDMRKPKVHLAFNDENVKGISTILINKHTIQECLRPTSIEHLFYIPSGPIPPNPSELIINKEFDLLLENLLKEFDTVIIDSPPVGLVTDGVLIMKKVDLPIYVIRAEYSKKGFEKNVNRLILKNNFNKLSVILNDFSNLSGYGYGYKYGYGYGYGYYSEANKDSKKGLLARILNKFRKA